MRDKLSDISIDSARVTVLKFDKIHGEGSIQGVHDGRARRQKQSVEYVSGKSNFPGAAVVRCIGGSTASGRALAHAHHR
jgi:hypothetical protein